MEHKELKGKLVSFITSDRLELQGFISESKPHNKKIIIHIHGMTGDFSRHPFTWHLAQLLKGSQYDLFTSNTRGYGIKTRFYFGKNKKVIGTAFEKFEESALDVGAAIKEAEKLGYDEIILSGHSTGCQKIAYYQAKMHNKKVKALILNAPADDFNHAIKKLGKEFPKAIKIAKKLAKSGKGNTVLNKYAGDYTAKRFLSYADPKNPEAEAFNYSGKLKQFSKIRQPMLAIFGSKEPPTDKTPKQMLAKLQERTKADMFLTAEIRGADHSFIGKEKEACKVILDFLRLID